MKVTLEVPNKKVMLAFNTVVLSSDMEDDEIEGLQGLVEESIRKGELELDLSLFDGEDVKTIEKALGVMVVIHAMEKDELQ